MNRHARRGLTMIAVVALVFAGACTKKDQDAEKVVGFIDATTVRPHRFRYEVKAAGADPLVVQAIVADDFARKLQLTVAGKPAVEEIIRDDAVAMRFLDPGIVDGYTDRKVDVDTKTDVDGATVFDALKASRWVVDEAGAPSAVVDLREEVGEKGGEAQARDPLFDARTALAYVRRIAQNTPFVKYDPESINPTYRDDEDPFPKPEDGSGVDRYDSVVSDLPTPAQATSSGTPTFPGAVNFRKMAVYVKDGRIIGVKEFIGASPRQLEKFERYLSALLKAAAPADVQASFKREIDARRKDPDKLSAFLLDGLNTFVAASGREPIRFREMSLTVQDGGDAMSEIALPSEAIKGNLAVIRNVGRKPIKKDELTSRPAVPQGDGTPTSASTASTVAP